MKQTLLIFFLCIYPLISIGQLINCSDTVQIENNRNRVNNIIGLIPSNARITNGWAIGWATSVDANAWCRDSLLINGVYTNISPFQIFMGGLIIPALLFPSTYEVWYFEHEPAYYDTVLVNHKLNGISLGLLEQGDEFSVQGLQLTLLFHNMGKLNGVSITTFIADYLNFNGVMLAVIFNKAYRGKGLQIGLINRAEDLKGVQIGLWNRIGDRALPIINMRF